MLRPQTLPKTLDVKSQNPMPYRKSSDFQRIDSCGLSQSGACKWLQSETMKLDPFERQTTPIGLGLGAYSTAAGDLAIHTTKPQISDIPVMLSACMYIYIYVCIYIYMYVCTHRCIHTWLHNAETLVHKTLYKCVVRQADRYTHLWGFKPLQRSLLRVCMSYVKVHSRNSCMCVYMVLSLNRGDP